MVPDHHPRDNPRDGWQRFAGGSLAANYTTHMGSEGHEIFKEVAFAIRVADEANIPVHIFHVKIRGKGSWASMPKYLDQIENARKQGLDITANQYPYTAMSKGWNTFFPLWARAGGPAKFAERLTDPTLRAKIKSDPDFLIWVEESGGWEGTTMSSTSKPDLKKYLGMSITEIAKLRGDADPADTCLDLMAEDSKIGGVYFNQSEENVRMVMPKPWVAIASDGGAINLNEPGLPHPRHFSTNARVLGYYVRDQHLLTLEDAVRKMTLPSRVRADSRPHRSRPNPHRFCGRRRPIRSGQSGRDEYLPQTGLLSCGHSVRSCERRPRGRQRPTHGCALGPSD